MIQDIIQKVLTEIGVNDLPEDDRYAVMAQLTDHFNKLVIGVVINNLNDEQLKEFQELVDLDDPEKMDEGISMLVAKIPAINVQIEEAINNEIIHIKASKEIIDRKD
jgi:hypothetical protein